MECDKIHIAMASNRRYLPGLRATTVSLIKATSEPQRLVFHVFSDGLSDEDKESLEEIAKKFGYEGRFDFRTPDMSRLTGAFKAYNGSHTTFLRLFFPEFLMELRWVLWTDVDMLWFRDPAKLWDERDDSVSVVWAPDIISTRKAARKQFKKWRSDFDMSKYACAGVMLMNLQRLRDVNFVEKSIDFVEKWGAPIFADQDILNEVCYGDTKMVDSRWNLLYPIDTIGDGVVVHFNGIGPKFNDSSCTGDPSAILQEFQLRYSPPEILSPKPTKQQSSLNEIRAPGVYWISKNRYHFTKGIKRTDCSKQSTFPNRANLRPFMCINYLINKPEPYFIKRHEPRVR